MTTAMAATKKPIMFMGHPDWWHPSGIKIELKESTLPIMQIVLSSKKVWIRICPQPGTKREKWHLAYLISHLDPGCSTSGNIIFSDEDLCNTFSLSENCGYESLNKGFSLLEKYGGTLACPGKFIYYKDDYDFYLNIPGPGTGCDGDPNVSILVGESIRNAVRELIDYKKGIS